MGIHIRQAVGSIRFSLGESTTQDEIDAVLAILPAEVSAARLLSTSALLASG
jgi:cysteine sulfinate desulfinase/cysteine desulfurase-like protein